MATQGPWDEFKPIPEVNDDMPWDSFISIPKKEKVEILRMLGVGFDGVFGSSARSEITK